MLIILLFHQNSMPASITPAVTMIWTVGKLLASRFFMPSHKKDNIDRVTCLFKACNKDSIFYNEIIYVCGGWGPSRKGVPVPNQYQRKPIVPPKAKLPSLGVHCCQYGITLLQIGVVKFLKSSLAKRKCPLSRCRYNVQITLFFFLSSLIGEGASQEQALQLLAKEGSHFFTSLFHFRAIKVSFSKKKILCCHHHYKSIFLHFAKVSLLHPTAHSLPSWLLVWNKALKHTENWQEKVCKAEQNSKPAIKQREESKQNNAENLGRIILIQAPFFNR